jgi:tellurite resistance protein TerC
MVSTGGFIMQVSSLVWAITLATMIVIFAVDLLIVGRRPHEPSMRESAIWVGVYVALAVVFGAVLLAAYGPRYGGEFFAGWLSEYSLSVDNLFVFVIIIVFVLGVATIASLAKASRDARADSSGQMSLS